MWLTESNRLKHFLYAIPCAYIGTIMIVVGLAAGMELKDRLYGNSWDWADFFMTILGGIVGLFLLLLTLYFIL